LVLVGRKVGGFFTRTARWRVVELNVTTEGSCVGFNVGTAVGLGAELTDAIDIGRPGVVDLVSLLTGLLGGLRPFGSLDFDLPNPKSLPKNPGFSAFCYTNGR